MKQIIETISREVQYVPRLMNGIRYLDYHEKGMKVHRVIREKGVICFLYCIVTFIFFIN